MSLRQWVSMMAVFARVFRAMPNLAQDLREISELFSNGAELPNTIGYSIINIAENKDAFASAMEAGPVLDAVRQYVVADPMMTNDQMVVSIEGVYQRFANGTLYPYVGNQLTGHAFAVTTPVALGDNLLSVVNIFAESEES